MSGGADTPHAESTVAGTIIARNYAAQATILATTYLQHHPGRRFVTLLIDAEADAPLPAIPGDVVTVDQLGLSRDELHLMAATYSVLELSTAVKAAFLLHLLETAGAAADVLGLPVTVDDDLIETDFGSWDGLTFAEAAAADP